MDIDHIDRVLGETLGVSHVRLDRLRLLGNPNLGPDTTVDEVLEGAKRLVEMVGPYKPVEGWTVRRSHAAAVEAGLGFPVFPIELYLTYEWEQA